MAKTTKLIDTNTLLYYHQAIKTLLGTKVDKLTGYSLMSDSEISRLSTVVNYNDTAVQGAISTMQGQIASLEAGTYDDTALKQEIAATYATIASLSAYVKKTELADVATSGSYNDLSNKPTIPVVDATLSATSTNAIQNKVVKTELDKKANSSSLSTVATSGSYTDLSNKPTIPSTPSEVGADASGSAASALTNAKSYTDSAVSALESTMNSKLTSAMHYKGDKSTYADLPTNAEVGDVWNIITAGVDAEGNAFSAGANAAWNGTKWDILPGTVDLTNYYNTTDLATNADIDTILNS